MTERSRRQIELAAVAAGGDQRAFVALIEDVRGFIMRQARKAAYGYSLPEDAIDDLYAESVLQVYANLDKFDPERGSWLAFVFWWTRAACQQYARRTTGAVRETSWASKMKLRLGRLRQALGPEVTIETLFKEAEIAPATGHALLHLRATDDVRVDDPNEIRMPLISEHTPEDDVVERAQSDTLHAALKRLDDRDRYVLSRRFGLDTDGEEATLHEVSLELGISGERVRQLERRALAALRKLMEEEPS